MIASLMAYGFLVAAFIGLAASSIEKGFGALHWPRRFVWVAAIAASLALPAIMVSVKHAPPAWQSEFTPQYQPVDTRPANSVQTQAASDLPVQSSASPAPAEHIGWPALSDLDTPLKAAWTAMSLGALAFYAVGWIRLRRATRHWLCEEINGASVFIADEVGPAVIGFLTPRIVIPSWLLAAPLSTRNMVMAHERSHIAARDPLLVLSALLLAAITPWNLPLLMQLRRLRFAIELDCDARVLRGDTDTAAYGEMLLTVGQHHTQMPIWAIALTEPASQLERRIRVMMTRAYRHAKWVAAACIVLSAPFIVAAAQFDAPALNEPLVVAQNSSPSREDQITLDTKKQQFAELEKTFKAIPIDPKLPDLYVGHYRTVQGARPLTLTITHDGNRFFYTQGLPGVWPPIKIFPYNDHEFFGDPSNGRRLQLTFVTDGQRKASEVVAHVPDHETSWRRMSDAEWAIWAEPVVERIKSNTPMAGSETMLRRVLDEIKRGDTTFEEMPPDRAQLLRKTLQYPNFRQKMAHAGAVQSVTFRQVDPLGSDMYDVKYENTSRQWSIALGPDGKVVSIGPILSLDEGE